MIKKILENDKGHIDLYNISYYGDLIDFDFTKSRNNDFMKMIINKEKYLPDIPSLNEIVKKYKEEDEENIEKIYLSIMKKHGEKIIKALQEFEKVLKNEIEGIKKDLSKF
jgi:hypothetical protein